MPGQPGQQENFKPPSENFQRAQEMRQESWQKFLKERQQKPIDTQKQTAARLQKEVDPQKALEDLARTENDRNSTEWTNAVRRTEGLRRRNVTFLVDMKWRSEHPDEYRQEYIKLLREAKKKGKGTNFFSGVGERIEIRHEATSNARAQVELRKQNPYYQEQYQQAIDAYIKETGNYPSWRKRIGFARDSLSDTTDAVNQEKDNIELRKQAAIDKKNNEENVVMENPDYPENFRFALEKMLGNRSIESATPSEIAEAQDFAKTATKESMERSQQELRNSAEWKNEYIKLLSRSPNADREQLYETADQNVTDARERTKRTDQTQVTDTGRFTQLDSLQLQYFKDRIRFGEVLSPDDKRAMERLIARQQTEINRANEIPTQEALNFSEVNIRRQLARLQKEKDAAEKAGKKFSEAKQGKFDTLTKMLAGLLAIAAIVAEKVS